MPQRLALDMARQPLGKAAGFGAGEQHFGAVDRAPAGERLDADDLAAGGLDLRLEAELDPVAADGRFEGAVASTAKRAPDRSIRRPLPPEYWPLPPSHGMALRRARHSSQRAIRARHRFGTVARPAKSLCCGL